MNDKMWRAIGQVSDTTLKGSDPENVRRHFRERRRKKALYIWWGALAACLLLVVLSAGVVTSVMLGGIAEDREMPMPGSSGSSFGDAADGNSASDGHPNEEGERYQNAWGYLSLVGYDSEDALYLFEKTDDTVLTLQGIVRLRDAEGNLCVMTNDPALREAGTYQGIPVLAQALTVRVTVSDGTPCGTTLTTAGTYRISLEMAELTSDGKAPVSVLFESFGEFVFLENP